MIVSASRRTDIPCYYSKWFINRLKEGYVLTRNPMNHAQVSKIPLSSDVVDCIVFWTKDPENIISKLKIIEQMEYKYYFQFTLNPYGNDIEKNLRKKTDIEDTFILLSKIIGKERLLWRYDPIIINDYLTIDYHKEQFKRLCAKLYNYTENVTISFVDMYYKIKSKAIEPICDAKMIEIGWDIGQIAKNYGITVKTCSEKIDLSASGINKGSCIDKKVIEKVCGYKIDIKVDKNQREACRCYESIDIGTYNTCQNGCVYCYANYSKKSVEANIKRHNINANMLNDKLKGTEKIFYRKAQSNKKKEI